MRGRSDTEILAWIASVGGTDSFLEEAFSCLSEAFRSNRAVARSTVIEWDIRTPDQGVVGYHIVVERGACQVRRGSSSESRVVLAVDMANFLRLLVGALDSGDAVSRGTLQLSGDMVLANTVRDWFQVSPMSL